MSTKTNSYESTLHASTFDPKRMELLLKHLAFAKKTRPGTKIATKKVPFLRERFKEQLADAEANPLTKTRVKWLARLCTELNGPEARDKAFQPRGTKALVTDLSACLN